MAFSITINAVDRTSLVSRGSFRKRDNLNQQVDECVFTINRTGSETYEPEVGQEVIVTRDSNTVFGGVILRINETVVASTIINYEVKCIDYSQYLKRKLVTERYTNTTVGAIISDIVTNYTEAGDGLTTNNVVGGQSIRSFSFDRLTAAECLEKLAKALSYVWYVDYSKDIHFFPKNTETAPYNLSDTSGNYIYNSLKITADLSQIRNSILVQGGEAVSADERTELFDGDGTKDTFALALRYSGKPTVEVGGVPVTVGTEFLDDEASFAVMWNFNEKYLRFTLGNVPAAGTRNIEVTGNYLFPIVVKVPAPSSIATYGEYQFALTDRSIRSDDEAIDRALAELEGYRAELYEGEFRTRNDGLRSGQVITINSTQRGKNIDVLIQSVNCKLVDPNADRVEYLIRFATLKSIGIIEYLQDQLRNKNVIVDDDEILTNYYPLADTFGSTDSIATPTATTGPYTWDNFDWGYATWS